MNTTISLFINNERVAVPQGASVAVAVLSSNAPHFRRSVSGEARAALCGMGICFECRVTINGVMQARSCQIACEPEMRVSTDA
jgi:D-hydroxyproline dehydrogenase subunit gamma